MSSEKQEQSSSQGATAGTPSPRPVRLKPTLPPTLRPADELPPPKPVAERLELPPTELSPEALSLRLDGKLDKQMPFWLRRTVDNVIYYLEVPPEPTLFGKIWHHRLRVPVLYALLGITIALVANALDFLRIYRLRGENVDIDALLAERKALIESLKTEEPNTLAALRSDFNQRLFNAEYSNALRIRSWPNEYLAKLEDLKDMFREKGKFMPWMDVKKEQDRFLSQQAIAEQNLAKDPPELRALQTEYYRIEDRLNESLKQRQKAIHEEFIKRLEDFRATAMTGGATSDVRAVEVEIEYLRKNMATLGLDATPGASAATEATSTNEPPKAAEEKPAANPPAADAPASPAAPPKPG